MTIHHATLARAVKLGFAMTEDNGEFTITNGKASAIGDNAKTLLATFEEVHAMLAEYPHLALSIEDDVVQVVANDETFEGEDASAVIAEALEACGVPEGSVAEDEEDVTRSIVPQKYRNEYRARGDATRCSDEFCERIDPFITVEAVGKNGKVKRDKSGRIKRAGDLVKTYLLAEANGISKTWPNLNKGQQCMNARNMVRNMAVTSGYVNVPAALTGGEAVTITFSDEWLNARR